MTGEMTTVTARNFPSQPFAEKKDTKVIFTGKTALLKSYGRSMGRSDDGEPTSEILQVTLGEFNNR